MTWRLGAWDRFRTAEFWWMHAMVCVWLIFAVMLFVLEPLFLERFLSSPRRRRSRGDLSPRRKWLHRGLLCLGLLTIAGAVAGSLGGNLFDW